mmetsp:Transcript_16493/g.33925  ORF Transcript_16493/g.33925 Transcript_16493/m.33925 type:complete len:953 (-) Transcript_16493:1550-4408(-)
MSRQMNECVSKSLHGCPPVIKIEDDDRIEIVDAVVDCKTQSTTNGDANTQLAVVSNTIPVKDAPRLRDRTKSIPSSVISSKDSSVEIATSAIESTEAADHAENRADGKGDKKNCKHVMNNFDAIADIAASSNLETRRKAGNGINTALASAPGATNFKINTQKPTIVTASMSNHYIPPRLVSAIGTVKTNPSNRYNKSNAKHFTGGSGSQGNKHKISVHMFNSVGLECGDDGVLCLEHFDEDENTSICADGVAGFIKTADEYRGDENTRSRKNEKEKPPQWTLEQHKEFAAAIFEIGLKNCSPSIIMENMRKQPRYITRERTKSHLQKYRQTKKRSKGEFLKEYDAFFKSTEQAKAHLNRKDSSSCDSEKDKVTGKRKEPIPKAILTTALEGKKPSKLLGGKAAALLSYSVLNGFSTNHGPDQLQYKAAKFTEFPSLTEEEKRSSVGASLLQVKSLLDNMTDVLLKTRHGIKPFPASKSGITEDESVSSSICSSDDGYSDDDDEDNNDSEDKQVLRKSSSKDQDPMSAAVPAVSHRGVYPMVPGQVGPTHPMYRGPPATYLPPFPVPGAPPPVPSGFPLQQFPRPQPSFYGGAPPPPNLQPVPTPGFAAPAAFHHPQMHYAQDPRMHPYPQVPMAQLGSYPPVPPMQPYYPPVPVYPGYHGNANDGNTNTTTAGANPEYPPHHYASSSGDVYAEYSRQVSGEHQQRQNSYDQQSPSYSNDGRGDRRSYDMRESPTEKSSRRRDKYSKRRRSSGDRDDRLSLDNIGEFLDRMSKVPSPSKIDRKSSSSPVQRSRRQGRYKSSPPLHSIETPIENPPNSYKNFESPEVDNFSESEISRFAASPFQVSPVHRSPSERNQNRARNNNNNQQQQQQRNENNGNRFWESSNFNGTSYNDQQQQAQPEAVTRSDQQQQSHINYGAVDEQQNADASVPMYLKGASFSSPEVESASNYFFGE